MSINPEERSYLGNRDELQSVVPMRWRPVSKIQTLSKYSETMEYTVKPQKQWRKTDRCELVALGQTLRQAILRRPQRSLIIDGFLVQQQRRIVRRLRMRATRQ
jgi:hypothetical protein